MLKLWARLLAAWRVLFGPKELIEVLNEDFERLTEDWGAVAFRWCEMAGIDGETAIQSPHWREAYIKRKTKKAKAELVLVEQAIQKEEDKLEKIQKRKVNPLDITIEDGQVTLG